MASKVDEVTNRLMDSIVKGKFANATLPPQDVLSREYGVSRTVVREAISKLEASDVVLVRPKLGTTIKPLADWGIVNMPLILDRLKAEHLTLSHASIPAILNEIRGRLFAALEAVDA